MIIFLAVTILLFNFAGITTTEGYLLAKLGILNPESVTSSGWYLALIGILTAIATGGIIIGIATRQSAESTFMVLSALTFIPIMLLIAMDLIIIIIKVSAFNRAIALLVGSPLLIVWILAVIDWWRGRG